MCLVFSRLEGSASYIGVLCILIAVVVTLVLWFYSRGDVSDKKYVIHDNTYLLRTAVVSLLAIMLFVGIIVVIALHAFEQHRATPIKTCTY